MVGVIVLNGTSSAGKTTLGRALQERLAGDWHLVGIDTLLSTFPPKRYRDGTLDFTGPKSPPFAAAYRHWTVAVASLSSHGLRLILDECFLDGADDQACWRRALDGVDVVWVGVHCRVDVAEAREVARGDRMIGLAAAQATLVHAGVVYDVEVDTTETSAEVLAATVIASLADR